MLGLVNIDYRNRKAELYIAIGDREYRGKNLGSKALQIALKYAFEELDLNRIYLFTHKENETAKKFYKKNGFTKEGLLRQHKYHKGELKDYFIYGMLKSEWLEQKNANKNMIVPQKARKYKQI